MDKVVSAIQKHSTPEQLGDLETLLKSSREVIAKGIGSIDRAMDSLKAPRNTLGMVHLLAAKAALKGKPDEALYLKQALSLCAHADGAQLRRAPAEFRAVTAVAAQIAIHKTSHAVRLAAVGPLLSAADKLATSRAVLTPQHADGLAVAVAAKAYDLAAPALSPAKTEVDPAKTGLVARDVLLFFYYSGLVWTALKSYSKAMEAFQMAVVTPAMAVSSIAVESYKKYLLLGLIRDGRAPVMPRYASPPLQRNLKSLVVTYNDLATACGNRNTTAADLQALVVQNKSSYQKDRNLGLVNQVVESQVGRAIGRLTKTYMTLSLADIASSVGLSGPREAEKALLRMIAQGAIHARINQKEGMVEFKEDPEQFSGSATLATIDTRLSDLIAGSGALRELDEEISMTSQYILKTSGELARPSGPGRMAGGDDDMLDFGLGGAVAGPSSAMRG